jgi:diguanylate cyclase (GGDEF)-like protein
LNGETTRERMQVRIVRRDGSALWCSMTRSVLRDRDGTPRFTMAQLEDATETRAVVDRLAALAHTDPLTGVTNRRGLDAELTGLLADAVASAPAALYFVDLDGFKVVNDRLGHAGGDVVLQTVAQRLIGLTRTGDTVARVGGDEFIVLARHVGSEEAANRLAERLRNVAVTVDDVPTLVVRASVGMARPRAYDSAQALIDRADRMMYRVKQARTVSDGRP